MLATYWRPAALAAAILVPAAARAATINVTVSGPDSAAVANATLVLTQPGTAGGARTPLDTAQTDAQGKFTFADLAAAQNYGVSVTATGLQGESNNNIDLGADTTVANVTFALEAPPPPADISGRVRNGVDTATAIAGATVVLSRAGTGGGARTPVDTATTDAQGAFAFADLAAADNYGLAITAAGFSSYTNNNIDLEGRDTALTIGLLPNADIGGTVLAGADAGSPPAAGAIVILTQPGTGGGGGGARIPVDTATADAEGEFAFADLPSMENYGLTVTADGLSTYTNNNIDLRGRDTSLTINLLGSADIGGTVFGPDTGTAVANATVILTQPGTGGGARIPVDTVATDAQGKFSFPDLASMDNYGLTVTATGLSTYSNNNIDLRGRDTSLTILLLGSADIGGTVVGPDSTTAVGNATVVLTRAGTGGGGLRTPVDTATTDAQGRFSFPDLTSMDNYGLTVTATGFAVYTNNNIDLRGRDTTVKVVLAPPPPPGTITGVVRGPGGAAAAPIPDATVVLSRPGTGGGAGGGTRIPVDTTVTNAQGVFTFSDVPAGDNYGLSVTVTGYNVAINNNVDLDGGDTATANFNLVVVSVLPPALRARGFAAAWSSAGLSLTLPPAASPRILSVYALSGALRHRVDVPAGIAKALIPSRTLQEKGLILELNGAGRRDILPVPGR